MAIEINRCSPVEMRKNLIIVEQFKKAGMDFVPIAVLNENHKKELIAQGSAVLDVMSDES